MFRYIYFLSFSPMRSLALTIIAAIAISSLSAAFAVDEPTSTTTSATETTLPILPAAPSVTASAGSSLGEYKSVSCNSNSAFAINNCDQCFD